MYISDGGEEWEWVGALQTPVPEEEITREQCPSMVPPGGDHLSRGEGRAAYINALCNLASK